MVKEMKKTSLGLLPNDWDVDILEHHLKIQTGSRNTEDKQENGKYPFFVRSPKIEHIDTYHYDCEAILTAGDGVGTGKVFHYINGKFDAHQRVYILTEFEGIKGKYFYYYFRENFLKEVSKYTAKSSVDSVRRDMIAKMAVPIPKIEEQVAIAEALSDVDNLISSLQKLIEKKKAIKQGAMQELLTGEKRLPGFHGEWAKQQLGDVCNIVNGGTPSTSVAEFWNGKILWCTPTDITSCSAKYIYTTESKITESGLKASSATLLPKGALLLCSRATIGEVRIAGNAICTNQGFKSLVVMQNISNEWLYYMVHVLKPNMLEKAIGSTFLEISKKDLAELDIIVPEFTEQKAIAQVLSDMDSEIEQLEKKLAKYQQIKQGMMQELLTGRIRLKEGENNA